MKKGTAFGLGTLAGAFGLAYLIAYNGAHGDVIHEDDNMEIRAASAKTNKGSTQIAYVRMKDKQDQEEES